MGFFNRLLQGRYGMDKLNLALFWGGIGCSVVTFTAMRFFARSPAITRPGSRSWQATCGWKTSYAPFGNACVTATAM